MIHLIDAKARNHATDIRQSFIVQAPAGSGKTELLTQRFLALLGTVEYPEQILAITFTNKAVHEMRQRVLHALIAAKNTDEQPSEPHRQKTWQLANIVLERSEKKEWNLLANPERLRIQTIDSLCSDINKKLPLGTHLASVAKITDDPVPYYELATERLFQKLHENSAHTVALTGLLTHLDNKAQRLKGLLVYLLQKRDQWLYHLYRYPHKNKRDLLELNLKNIIINCLKQLDYHLTQDIKDQLIDIISYLHENNKKFFNVNTDQKINYFPAANLVELPSWLMIANLLLTQSNSFRKKFDKSIGFISAQDLKSKEDKKLLSYYKNKLADIIATLESDETIHQLFIELRTLPPAYYTQSQWNILEQLTIILPLLVAELHIIFSEHMLIDYIENTQTALLAFGDSDNPTDIALQWDHQLKHLLVDEFQDTSINHYRLIEKIILGWELQDGRTLFFVGDPMQSIYRFRNAEVSLFLRAKTQSVGHIKLNTLQLSTNFRSTSTIVNWLNYVFAQIFPPLDRPRYGASQYSSATAALLDDKHSAVKLHAFHANDKYGQALSIIDIIQQTKKKSDIAILVRNKNHLATIIPLLKQHGIIYHAIDIDALAKRPWIIDLLSLTRALLNSHDRLAWLSVLRAPWCGLTLADLHTIANATDLTIIGFLRSDLRKSALSDDGIARLAIIAPLLICYYERRGRQLLAPLIEKLWHTLQGSLCYLDADPYTDAYRYFELVATLEQGGDILDLSLLERKLDLLFAHPKNNTDDAIQIMTIHKAKGLEFNTVIIPSLHAKSKQHNTQLLSWMEQLNATGSSELLLAPLRASDEESNGIYEYIAHEEAIKSDYEIMRLFYVACTRAKSNLHLMTTIEFNQDGKTPTKPPKGSLLHAVWPLLATDFLATLATEPKASVSNEQQFETCLNRLALEDLLLNPHTK